MRVCAGLVLSAIVGANYVNMLQWNPHYQCFLGGSPNCPPAVNAQLYSMLRSYDVDFANVVMLEMNYTLPPGYRSLNESKCGYDVTNIIYNSARWDLDGTSKTTCLDDKPDRAVMAQKFKSRSALSSTEIVVIGAHFGHQVGPTNDFPSLTRLSSFVAQHNFKGAKIVLIADTNIDPWDIADKTDKNTLIYQQALMSYAGLGTDYDWTCCLFNEDGSSGITHQYDSIIANFGKAINTTVLALSALIMNAAPVNATYHLPVVARLGFD